MEATATTHGSRQRNGRALTLTHGTSGNQARPPPWALGLSRAASGGLGEGVC